MAYFSPLISLVFFLLSVLPISSIAQATYTVTFAGVTSTNSTVAEAADAIAVVLTSRQIVACTTANGVPTGYSYFAVQSVNGLSVQFVVTYGANCGIAPFHPAPVLATTNAAPVTCAPGQSRDPETNTCDCDSNYQVGGQMVNGDSIDGCKGGCKILLKSGWYDKTANVTWGRDWVQTGSKCVVSDQEVLAPTDPKATEAQKCGAGLCPGTVNGQAVCVACTSPRETTTNKDASTEVSTPASGASSATSSTSSGSSTTKCEGDKCTTTTTTTTNPDGSKTDKTSTKEQPKSDFCTDNPRSSICKEGGTWGGSCGSFSCDGDAVTCAIAQASWKSACALDIEPTDSKVQAGNTALSGGDRPAGHPGNNPSSSLFTANLDQTNPYGSTCPADIPLNVMGNVVSIPLSSACDTFRLMGQVAVAFTLLAAAFVIFGGVKG